MSDNRKELSKRLTEINSKMGDLINKRNQAIWDAIEAPTSEANRAFLDKAIDFDREIVRLQAEERPLVQALGIA